MWPLWKWLVWHCLEEQLCALHFTAAAERRPERVSPRRAQVTVRPWVSSHYLISDVPPWSFLLECARLSALPVFLPPVINKLLRLSLRPWPWWLLMRGRCSQPHLPVMLMEREQQVKHGIQTLVHAHIKKQKVRKTVSFLEKQTGFMCKRKAFHPEGVWCTRGARL